MIFFSCRSHTKVKPGTLTSQLAVTAAAARQETATAVEAQPATATTADPAAPAVKPTYHQAKEVATNTKQNPQRLLTQVYNELKNLFHAKAT